MANVVGDMLDRLAHDKEAMDHGVIGFVIREEGSRSSPAVNNSTLSEAVLTSARYDCQSRDMDQVSLDFGLHFRAQGIGSAQVDRPTERIFEIKLQIHEPVEGGLPVERNQDVQVALLMIVAPRHRSEDAQSLETKPERKAGASAFRRSRMTCRVMANGPQRGRVSRRDQPRHVPEIKVHISRSGPAIALVNRVEQYKYCTPCQDRRRGHLPRSPPKALAIGWVKGEVDDGADEEPI